jgi:hypothetical protein
VAKVDMNGLRLVEMHPFAFQNWKLMWKCDLHPKLYYSKRHWSSKFSIKFVLLKAKHLFTKLNCYSSNLSCGIESVRNFDPYSHSMWFEPI